MATQKNEGEGNRTAAGAFNRDQKRFAESGKVEPAARDAERALDTKEAERLRDAERQGKQHSHGEDPAVSRRGA
jgi:hypothetical protein